jgi:N-methylhydantoinase A/oxoprolinase/acetone carboxylase beta subunit
MQVRSRAWRIGMDIGDTFTDLLLVNRDGRPALA